LKSLWRPNEGRHIQKRGNDSLADETINIGGQGVHREVESEGHEEKYRAVIDEGYLDDEPVGQRWGKVESALWRRRRFSFTHRTKVFAGGTIQKNSA
jgi:hypothetical protein